MKKIVLVLPCYHEEEILESSFLKLNSLFDDLIGRSVIHPGSSICFVDDGSSDSTWDKIKKLSVDHSRRVIGVKLSRNYGHQFALLAGLESMYNKYDCYITIDADLQDDINVIEEMVEHNENGSSIVYGVRKGRKNDSFFKRETAKLFYRLMDSLGVNTVYNHADFRLMDNRALGELLKFRETNVFLRGIIPSIGLGSSMVYYDRLERTAGETKYPLKKMLAFAWDGITSFSNKPLRIILLLGMMTLVISFFIFIWVVYTKISGKDIQGWTSIMMFLVFFSSIQMIFTGIIGEYLGKIFLEIKRRPRYIVDHILQESENSVNESIDNKPEVSASSRNP